MTGLSLSEQQQGWNGTSLSSGSGITIPRLKAVVVRWQPCANGVAVPNPQDNPGLVADCSALLEVKDAIAGGATL